MSTLRVPQVLVVRSVTHLEIELLKRPSPFIEFHNEAAEKAYEKLDHQLALRVYTVAGAACGELNPEDFVFTSWDWSPNESCAITIDRKILSAELVNAMLASLVDVYASWRIHLNVHENLAGGGTEFGAACLFQDLAIIEQTLCPSLNLDAQAQ